MFFVLVDIQRFHSSAPLKDGVLAQVFGCCPRLTQARMSAAHKIQVGPILRFNNCGGSRQTIINNSPEVKKHLRSKLHRLVIANNKMYLSAVSEERRGEVRPLFAQQFTVCLAHSKRAEKSAISDVTKGTD